MDLPLPYAHRGTVVRSVEIGRPTAGDIAGVARLAGNGDPYAAMGAFVVGGTTEILADSGPLSARQDRVDAARDMPFVDTNWVIVQILLGLGCSDRIEGAYDCPRCGKTLVSDEQSEDRVSLLSVRRPDPLEPQTITASLGHPVEVRNDKGAVVERVEVVEFRFATMADCSRAVKRSGEDSGRLNLEILRGTILKVNGNAVDDKYRSEWGDLIVSRMDVSDVREVSRLSGRFGYVDTIERCCSKCGKTWQASVDLTGFFVSGLRGLSA